MNSLGILYKETKQFDKAITTYEESLLYKKENFTPYINGIVRPHIRNVRRHVENYSDDTNSFFRKMIRKSGLYY